MDDQERARGWRADALKEVKAARRFLCAAAKSLQGSLFLEGSPEPGADHKAVMEAIRLLDGYPGLK